MGSKPKSCSGMSHSIISVASPENGHWNERKQSEGRQTYFKNTKQHRKKHVNFTDGHLLQTVSGEEKAKHQNTYWLSRSEEEAVFPLSIPDLYSKEIYLLPFDGCAP